MAHQIAVTTLLQALQALYHHPDAEFRKAASRWLEDFQQAVDAWQISDSLLHEAGSSLEVQYFCAQTLRTKVQRDFEELPTGAALSLRSSLVSLLVKFRQGPAAVRTQLCMAIAALAGHMSAADWEQGGGVVKWLAGQLGSPTEAMPAMLELLAVIPQEAYSLKLALRPERRRQYYAELLASVDDALNLLVACLNQGGSDAEVRNQVLGAFAAWLRLSTSSQATILANHPLVTAALDGLDSSETFDQAVDAVCELIKLTVSGSEPTKMAEYMPLVQVLVPRVMALRPRFAAAVKAAIAERNADEQQDSAKGQLDLSQEDEETTKGIARLFAEMGEAYVDLIASGSREAMLVAEALTEVTAHPDSDIASTTFQFWHRLRLALFGSGEEDGSRLPDVSLVETDRRIAMFRPLFELLVSLVSGRVMYPAGFDQWRRDEKVDFKRARYAIADLLLDAAAVLGGEATVKLLAQPLFQLASAVDDDESWSWQTAEASLYCIRAVAEAVPKSEATILPRIMAMLPTFPKQPQLLYTASLTIAAYCDWLAVAPHASTMLPPLLGLLTSALSAPDDAPPAAALALKHVCDACRDHLVGSIDALLHVYQRVMAGEGIDSSSRLNLAADDELQVVEGLSKVISALSPDRVQSALQALCMPLVVPLQEVVRNAQQAGPQDVPSAGQYIVHIDRIANIFRYVHRPEHLAVAFEQMWPLLRVVFEQRASDTRVMERLCRACKYAIRSAGKHMGPVIGPLLEEVQRWFAEHRQPCLLYVASEVIKAFGGDSSCAAPLGSLIQVLFSQTIQLLRDIKDFTNNPDTADDCFLLASRCIRYCPHLIVPTPILPQLLDCAMAGMTVQHREACKSILAFTEEVLLLPLLDDKISYRPAVEAAVVPRGSTMMRILIGSLAGALPTSRTDELVGVVSALARLCGPMAVQWATETVSRIPTIAVTDAEKNAFVQAITTTATGAQAQALVAAMEEMSDVCRRNKKILDSVQTALQPLQLALPTPG
ncbi:hypothetical protein CBR_g24406 [Chara braunii]|uniref:Importin N-terminal domain-containing protein n=1 Tax=Chara braunii TaxID=69332 RepID=A0A388JMK1_CHABU|nr:hypothetical protein CBR_g24406 [Chara braunii]|eukprot:GBG59060.1 hypothetical protein CBR_g24406 [Chara braunii]